MGSTAAPLRLLQGGAPGTPTLRLSRLGLSRVGSVGSVVPLAARRRAGHLGELRALLEGIDALWSSLWRSYPGREREVVELHLRFDGLRDGVIAWAAGQAGEADAVPILHRAIASQLEGAAILGAPTRGAASWRSLCRQLETLEARVASLDFG